MADEPAKQPQSPVVDQGQKQGIGQDSKIFAMPKEFRGSSPTAKPAAPVSQAQSVQVQKQPVQQTQAVQEQKKEVKIPVQGPAKAPMAAKKKRKILSVPILAVGIVFLGLIIAGAIYVFSTLNKKVPTPVVLPPVEQPLPVPAEQPEPAPEPAPAPQPPEEEPQFIGQLRSGIDTDSDGLTDAEESLYSTNMRKPDTDSDGFLDGNEVFHRYNPAGTAPLTLLESGFVKVYSNSLFSIQYPSQWTAVGQDFAVEFTALSGEKISISVQPRSLEGYLGAVLPAVYNAFTTKNGYSAALSEDQLTAVIDLSVPAKEAVLVSLIYKPDGNGEIDYLQTFKMMINSLQFVQPAE